MAKWLKKEDALLINLKKAGLSYKVITREINGEFNSHRSDKSIRNRINALGLAKKMPQMKREQLKTYTKEQEEWLKKNCKKYVRKLSLLVKDFNERFNDNKTMWSIKAEKGRLGLTDKNRQTYHYTKTQERWILNNYKKYLTIKEMSKEFTKKFDFENTEHFYKRFCDKVFKILGKGKFFQRTRINKTQTKWILSNYDKFDNYGHLAKEFNKKFNKNFSQSLLQSYCWRKLKLKADVYNEKRWQKLREKTSWNSAKVGTIKEKGYANINLQKYKYIKVSDEIHKYRYGENWKRLDYYIYEKATNDKIGDKETILHLDGDITNNNISNLYKISKNTSAYINKYGYWNRGKEFLLTICKLGEMQDLEKKIMQGKVK